MIEIYMYILFFIFGVVIGSFYNVLGLRIPKDESIIKPKSHCPKCQHELKWYELIPIISYIFQKGKCKKCHQKISIMYPFIEFGTGILFFISYYSFGLSYELIISLTISSLLMLVIVSDLTYLMIPDRFIVISAIIIVIINFLNKGLVNGLLSILYGILSFILMYLIMLLGNKLFKKESMGGADIKLMFLVGLSLDPMLSTIVILIAALFALPVSLYLLIKKNEHVVPFGPFIVFGLLLVYFLKMNIIDIFNKFI